MATVMTVVAGGCNWYFIASVGAQREGAGLPNLGWSPTLNADAQSSAAAMCAGRGVLPSPSGAYQETPGDVHELVAAVPSSAANLDASLWTQWRNDPEIDATRWKSQGAGETTCADGNVYAAEVLKAPVVTLPNGRYSTQQYDPSTVRQFLGIQYTTAVDYTGTTIPLLLDVYTPPVGAPSPRATVVLIHGGAFVGGSRTDEAGDGKQWAARGYDAVSIDYRLDQSLYQDSSPPKELAAASNATEDAEQAVRWMKANAATYGVDVTRIAAVGNSAGGAVALGMSVSPDFRPPTQYASYSSKIAAAVSTGAYLTPGIDLGVLHLTAGLAPILMFHYETDVASNTGVYAFRTCSAYRAAGSVCDYVSEAGEGHTTDLSAGGYWWASQLGPFIWRQLNLGS
ncbi:MAG TPA: alpha/beta hydrolase [Acidimicrobiia bacterium]|nr:alpha/beta hydrolase [Acidimicrobiia bacterium]